MAKLYLRKIHWADFVNDLHRADQALRTLSLPTSLRHGIETILTVCVPPANDIPKQEEWGSLKDSYPEVTAKLETLAERYVKAEQTDEFDITTIDEFISRTTWVGKVLLDIDKYQIKNAYREERLSRGNHNPAVRPETA